LGREAGPQLIDILVAVLKRVFDLAFAVVVEADDLEEVPLREWRGTLSCRFWLRLLTASSRYSFSCLFIPTTPFYF
jgi:hypothetical protein